MRALLVVPARRRCRHVARGAGPLREALAKADRTDVESAVRACLTEGGWKVDDVGSYAAGANVVTAYKAKDQTDVYIYGAATRSRASPAARTTAAPSGSALGGHAEGRRRRQE